MARRTGSVFVSSSSGAKTYPLADDGWDKFRDLGVSLTRPAENTQFYQFIAIDGGTLAYEARTATGRVGADCR